jgi:hypothetical protein
LIEFRCLGSKKHTTSKDDVGKTAIVQWSEHLFFEKNNVVTYLEVLFQIGLR